MSLEALILVEPRARVLRPAVDNETDAAGLPIHGPIEVLANVAGRIKKGSAAQVNAWLALGIECRYEFITQEGRIQNGWFLEVNGRRFQVTGVRGVHYTKGTIPSHWDYPLVEMDFGDETPPRG